MEESGGKWKGQSLCPPDLLEILDLFDILALLGRPGILPHSILHYGDGTYYVANIL